MISSIIVVASVVFGLAFLVAWLCSPALRRWVERPKYNFLARVQRYDRTHRRS
jgi:hypothetical protein